jgi:geranylgeranyl diphosphate synthase type II
LPSFGNQPSENERKTAMVELASYLDQKRVQINAHLEQCFDFLSSSGPLIEAMRYSLMAGGKRLRPVLCIAGAEAVGGRADVALPAASALEMIHTYSLIHDDLPAMDDDNLRRGKPTCHVRFGEATAILAGDALLTLAFQLLSDTRLIDESRAVLWLDVIQRISRAAGCQGMVEGQVRDIAAENHHLSRSALEQLHALKTGALIEASVCCGAVLGGGDAEQIDRLETYAACIGLAFQVKDDILNVEGDPDLLGKGVGTDEARQKSTYPSLMGLDESKTLARELINKALRALEPFDQRSDPLRAIADYIIERKR